MVHPSLIGNAIQYSGLAPVAREVIRTVPHERSGGASIGKLGQAYEQHVASTGRRPADIEDARRIPDDNLISKAKAIFNTDAYSSAERAGPNYRIKHNPNADQVLLAHELGHVSAQQTDIGRLISNLRHHPALSNALTKAALLTVPAGAVAALSQGDDDMAGSVALAYAMAAPTIADEALATHHGLQIMDRAGLRPHLGGRAKLAGGLLSYMATPLAVGATANMVGNLMDDELVGPPSY